LEVRVRVRVDSAVVVDEKSESEVEKPRLTYAMITPRSNK